MKYSNCRLYIGTKLNVHTWLIGIYRTALHHIRATLTYVIFRAFYTATNQIQVRVYIFGIGSDLSLKSRPVYNSK